jgi:hypothetical protein
MGHQVVVEQNAPYPSVAIGKGMDALKLGMKVSGYLKSGFFRKFTEAK